MVYNARGIFKTPNATQYRTLENFLFHKRLAAAPPWRGKYPFTDTDRHTHTHQDKWSKRLDHSPDSHVLSLNGDTTGSVLAVLSNQFVRMWLWILAVHHQRYDDLRRTFVAINLHRYNTSSSSLYPSFPRLYAWIYCMWVVSRQEISH